jgi:repressor LexA
VNDEVTVKRLKRRGHQIQLLPENPDFAPIEVDARKDQLVIEGIGVGIVRNGRSL